MNGLPSGSPRKREVVGVDLFVEFDGGSEVLGDLLEEAASHTPFRLKMISNRGAMVYPLRGASTDCVSHWRCRFLARETREDLQLCELQTLLQRIEKNGLKWMHLEKLNRFDNEDAFTKAQGED